MNVIDMNHPNENEILKLTHEAAELALNLRENSDALRRVLAEALALLDRMA